MRLFNHLDGCISNWLFDLLSLHVIFTYYYIPPKPFFSSWVPTACDILHADLRQARGEWLSPSWVAWPDSQSWSMPLPGPEKLHSTLCLLYGVCRSLNLFIYFLVSYALWRLNAQWACGKGNSLLLLRLGLVLRLVQLLMFLSIQHEHCELHCDAFRLWLGQW